MKPPSILACLTLLTIKIKVGIGHSRGLNVAELLYSLYFCHFNLNFSFYLLITSIL